MTLLWAKNESKLMNLKDSRRNTRAAKILELMMNQPTASIPQANNSWASTKATYRFTSTVDFDAQDILEGHYQATFNRINDANQDVIIISDSTDIYLQTLKKTEGLGILSQNFTRGIKSHNTLVFNSSFIPLGLVEIKYWTRNLSDYGTGNLRKYLPIKNKETYVWIQALEKVEKNLPQNIGYTFIADGGADVYDFLSTPRRPNGNLLIHLVQNRAIKPTSESPEFKIYDAVETTVPIGNITINLPRTPTKKARQVTLEIKAKIITIQPPTNRNKNDGISVELTAIIATEIKEPKSNCTNANESQKIIWRLLTTKTINTLDDATECITLYTKRWLIERYHYILKQGCGIEKLQMESAENLKRAAALYSIVAWRLMYLTYIARINPEAPCTIAFSSNEWQALWCYVYKKQIPPNKEPTVKAVILLLAKLGGFLARKNDYEPGAKVIWRGLMALDHIVEMFSIFKPNKCG